MKSYDKCHDRSVVGPVEYSREVVCEKPDK